MKVIELFAGTRSIGKAAEALGLTVWSTDIEPFEGIDLVANLLHLTPDDIPHEGKDTIIWASPPCTAFSIAGVSHHWTKDKTPKSLTCWEGIELVKHTIELIQHINPAYWYIENPRGLLRKQPYMQGLGIRNTVTYCQYGDTRMKPTDIWTNNSSWVPKPMCRNGSPCHIPAPRGSKTGTQGLPSAKHRSKIPAQLCTEVIQACL